jgi:CHAT domain-containing protein
MVESQCSLEDEPNSKLMKRFYKEMNRSSDITTAIRVAMLSMKLKKGSPVEVASSVYDWEGYLVWGLPTVTLPPSMLKCF